MLRRLNLHLRSVFKDRLPLFPRIHEKPVSNHLQARVPIELIYRIIDLYLKEDLGALKTLTLTSRTLYLYCRRFIHATITIEARAQGSPSLIERFAELLKRNPQLADLVHVLHFWHIPHSTPPNAVRFRVSKEEKALCYVLDKLHNLKMIRLLGTPGLQWDSLHRKVQLAIIERLQQEGLNTVFMRFLSLPTHVLSACNSVQDMRLCGSLVEKESAQVRVRGRGPTQLGLCHIDRPYLPLLSSSKTWDITGIQTLLLGQIPMLDVHHLNFICAFSSSLVTLQFEPYSFYGEQVIPTLDLSMLPSLQVIKTGAQAVDIWLALDWIARTLDTRPDVGPSSSVMEAGIATAA
ncbi:hypothetical protein CC1G_02349 [Coprinopsis cinerea okayama7|uniref:F-box domain-containing protein n=1 Tax=Coprinopsis cinerea (strain Okayama-7 / 130 / ATCC MYA-4618 / FGSC 9003) TaxID=240176 RepID=A8N7U2_COPC7|nr:hypothetical protein CC1G_02349 [Coprinopsis cinerea okayama7\|eukprot:XP_001830898.2 hypothetical protein CC1G_02349 [Coprinopsis cinerea okayama7\